MMAEEERQIRTAAETLLTGSIGSVNSQRGSYSQQYVLRTPDIILSEDLIAGARHNGQMSNVRRFFCLLVTFDLLFTCLMWIICFVISGEDLRTAFVEEVEHYTITTSLFDVVMAAICRFTVLLLFYALLYLNHWIIIALSTSVTCAFLIAKVFFYDWKSSHQPVYQVLLVIASFILAWAETWHFDFRVIPQETQARNWYRNTSDPERSPLLRGAPSDTRQYNSIEPIGTFFTPMDSPAHSDVEEDGPRRSDSGRRHSKTSDLLISKPLPKLTPEKCRVLTYLSYALVLIAMLIMRSALGRLYSLGRFCHASFVEMPSAVLDACSNMKFINSFFFGDKSDQRGQPVWNVKKHAKDAMDNSVDEYKQKASTLIKSCYDLLTSNNWKVVSTTPEGDVISYMLMSKHEGKIWKITGVVDAPARSFVNWLYDKIEDTARWNKNVTESVRLQQIDEDTDIIYQATNPYGGGLVSARDFIILRNRGQYEDYYISSGMSIPLPAIPDRKHFTRGENGIGCWAAIDISDGQGTKCSFTWILNTNLKGWIPQKLVDVSLSGFMVDYMNYLRKYLKDSQKTWD